ncbi:hypothetical protein B0H10DRAFT_2036780 [Mycena sp. CBHHK59/15]|nr:hypothetical protein B0H10DRAFT_2036780 [Mycena sp. CBHHK59/15]
MIHQLLRPSGVALLSFAGAGRRCLSKIVERGVDSVVPGPLLWAGTRRVGGTLRHRRNSRVPCLTISTVKDFELVDYQVINLSVWLRLTPVILLVLHDVGSKIHSHEDKSAFDERAVELSRSARTILWDLEFASV